MRLNKQQELKFCYSFALQILHEYERRGFEFLLQAFNTPDYLEDITGLTQLHKETEDAEVCLYLKITHVSLLQI